MKRILSNRILMATLVVLASLLVIYQKREPPTTSSALTEIQNVDTLREQFNRDVGRPRLILLVSPT